MRKRTRVKNWLTAISLVLVLTIDAQADRERHNITTFSERSEFIQSRYAKLDFCHTNKLDPHVFELAYKGYENLRAAGKVSADNEILSVADYSLSANVPRLWIIDLKENKVVLNTYVAHGQGTGEEFATSFSNRENSHQSSLGFYVTGATYIGEHGLSLYLHGMDKGYNSAAFQRSVVIHGAAYVSESFIRANHRLGRSWGCPAVSEDLAPGIINTIKDGTCLFVYHPDNRYLASSRWLKDNGMMLNDTTMSGLLPVSQTTPAGELPFVSQP